ncbi:MAG: EexN family lipoprotein [Hyphomicrobium sp.]
MMAGTYSQQYTATGWHLHYIVFGLVLSWVIGLAGCTKEELEPVQTVAWYKAHEAERIAMATKCHSNPGLLEKTPNCINALTAGSDIFMGR